MHRPLKTRLLAVVLTMASATSGFAALISVDFDQTSAGATQSGFTSFAGTTGTAGASATNTIGGYSVTVGFPTPNATNQGYFFRGGLSDAGAFTFSALYNDFVYSNAAGDPIKLSIQSASIVPGTSYLLTLYSFDPKLNTALSETTTFTPTGATTGNSGSVTYSKPSSATTVTTPPTSNSDKSVTLLVTAGSNTLEVLALANNIIFQADGTRLNGFELNPVPEPSAIISACSGAIVLLGFWARRRRTVA